AVRLGEMPRQTVGPAVRVFEKVDRRRDVVSFGATGTIPAPLIASLRLGMASCQVARSERAHSGGRQEQGIFDPLPQAPHALAEKPLEKPRLLIVRRRHEQTMKQGLDMAAIERARDP